MGASGWDYFTPYQPDINLALQSLRREVFSSGKYETPWGMFKDGGNPLDQIFDNPEMKAMLAAMKPEERAQFEDIMKQQRDALSGMAMPEEPPAAETIDELLEQCEENGTHSILDIAGVAATREFGMAFPMPPEIVRELYGTDQPTREQVEAKKHERADDLDRWECWYVIVFKGGKPSEIYFEGVSGD